jgi:hypothetical protein
MDARNLKPTFFITLFEKQLVRSYLLSDNGDFLRTIANYYNINIITSKELEKIINEKIKNFKLTSFTSITVFEKFKENIAIKIISSIFLYSNKSSTTIQVINMQKLNDKHILKTVLRYMNYWLISDNKIFKQFLRYLYSILVNLSDLNRLFTPNLNLRKNDILFITSLHPLRGQDIPIGVYFRKRKIKIIGTVRSWDNLSINIFKLIPEFFLCHSDYMLDSAIYKQGIKEDKILMSVTPSYQAKFLIKEPREKNNSVNFSYMCMGLTVNPDEENFIKWLVWMWEKMPTYFVLNIVQHPSFIMSALKINLPDNVNLIVFNYEATTLNEYYNHLYNMDLVFGGGTTGLLDASFLGVPIIAIKFEVIKQNYWQSSLRYFDYFPWTADFFDESRIFIAHNKQELENYILNYKSILPLDKDTVLKFTGNPNLTMSEIILNKITNF